MATVTKWNPFGVALNLTATPGVVTRTSATKFTVRIDVSWEVYYDGAKTKYGMVASSGGKSVTLKTFNNTAASSGSGYLVGEYSISGNSAAAKGIQVVFENFNNDNGDHSSKTVGFLVSVPAWTSYTVTYNANGGTGAPAAQTKWKDQTLTLTSTKPTRSGYNFLGWSPTTDSIDATYYPGGSYTKNEAITLYAVWDPFQYSVNYDANGGTGAPSKDVKLYGISLTLSNTIPTRTNYRFLGWSAASNATTPDYTAGGKYLRNVPITLYAVWELAYTKPRIKNLSISRCDSDGTLNDSGTSALVTFDYECDVSASYYFIRYKHTSESEYPDDAFVLLGAAGTTGSPQYVITKHTFDVESSYDFSLYFTDTNGGASTSIGMLSSMLFAIDFLAGGRGVAIGKAAEEEGLFDIGLKTRFIGGLLPVVLDPNTNLNDIRTPNTYTGANISNYNYENCPVTSGTFTLIVESCGEDGQVRQTYISCSKYKPERFVRFYYQSAWGDWFWAGTEEVVLYESDTGTNGVIELSASLANYRYVEIYFTDNNGRSGGYTKVWSPNGKTICLSIVETSSVTSVLQRQTMYVLSSQTMMPNLTIAGYIQFNPSTKLITNSSTGTNYIKIVRVIGRA